MMTTAYTTQELIFERRDYPAGEDHSILRDIPADITGLVIEAHCRSLGDLARVRVQDDILARNGIDSCWFIPYFPCARQDRRETQRSGFELGYAFEIVKGMNLVIADPHSDVAGQLSHFTQKSVYDCFASYVPAIRDCTIVIPDAGAAKKAYEWAVGNNRQIVQSLKVRDPKTGKLSGFKVIAKRAEAFSNDWRPGDLDGKDILIVDDICDAGGTFLGLGKLLKEDFGVKTMTLAVTHGLFTKGTKTLKEMFDRIITFCPTSPHNDNPDVIEIPFKTLYNDHYKEIL